MALGAYYHVVLLSCAPAVRYTSADTDSRQQHTAEGACAPRAPAAHRSHAIFIAADCDDSSSISGSGSGTGNSYSSPQFRNRSGSERPGDRGYRQPGQEWCSRQPESTAEQIAAEQPVQQPEEYTAELTAIQSQITALETQFEALSVPQTPQTPEQSMRQQTAPRSPMAVLWDRGHQLLSELMSVSPTAIQTGGVRLEQQ
jgi:hypothetical protein